MPELDILYGFEFATLQLKERWYRLHGVSLTASLQIFPRAFAVGTKKKNYVTCTVDDSARCDYQDNLEPMPEGFIPNKYDLQKSKGKAFERYLKPLKAGELFVKARGKEIVFAAGHHLVRAHFGLEGTMVIIKTNDYNMMIANDCPGNNSNPGKALRMRSFIVPPHLTVPGARGSASDDRQQTMAIFAAVVGVEHTILLVDHNRLLRLHILSRAKPWTAEDLKPEAEIWPDLWSKNHGPDWTYETQHAEQVLDNWRQGVLAQGAASAQPAGVPESTLLDVMCSSQDVFNAGTSCIAPSRGDLSQQNCQKLAVERERSGAYRSELHNARRREHRLRDAKANLQARLKHAEAGRKRDAAAAKTQLKTVQAKAAEDVGNAEVRAKAAEARAFEAEAQMEGAVDQATTDIRRAHDATTQAQRMQDEVVTSRQLITKLSAELVLARSQATVAVQHHQEMSAAAVSRIQADADKLVRAAETRADEALSAARAESEQAGLQVRAAAAAIEGFRHQSEATVDEIRVRFSQHAQKLEMRIRKKCLPGLGLKKMIYE
ncbi:hypothetical protein ACG7TL_004003 [Trametes sanguinea]